MTTDAPGQSAQLFLRVVRILDQKRIPYAAIGALAAAYFGVVRASLDTDAVISLGQSQTTLDDLLKALRSEGLSVTAREADASDPLLGVIAVEDTHHNRADIILGIRGMDPAAFSRTLPAPLLGSSIRMIGIDDFIAMKIFAGGPRDIEDVRGVLNVSRDLVHMEEVRRLTARYGAREHQLLESLLAEA
jgi:hypothetical protein